MIHIATVPHSGRVVGQNSRAVLQVMDAIRDESALELGAVLDGVSVKKIKLAGVPGAGPYHLSRATNGGDNNPLYRIAGLFVLMKRLGLSKARAQRIVDWLQDIVEELWPEGEADLETALEQDSEIDPKDDHLRFQAAKGCVDSMRELLEVKRGQRAHSHLMVIALRRRLQEQG